MSDSAVRIIFMGDSDSATRAVGRLDSRIGSLDRGMRNLKRGAAIGIGAITTALFFAERSAIGFDRSMRNVNSIARVNEKQFAALEKRVLALAKVSGQAPKVLADGLYDIVSSGFKANDAIKVLAVSAKAATAGMTDTATASKAVVAVLNAYHLGAGRAKAVSDVLFQTVNKGVLTFSELSAQIGDVLPYASRLNIPLTDLGGAMATITLHGVNAAEAATQLKQVMASTIAPSKDLGAEIKKLGFESGQAMLHQLGFQGTVRKLSAEAGGNIGVLHSWFPNIRALSGFLGISGKNAKQLSDNIKSMTGASKGAGATNKAFAEQGKSISVQWDKATAGLTASAITLGTQLFPVLRTGIGYLSDFAGWVGKLAGQHTINAKVNFVADTALGLGGMIKDLLFGKTTIKPVRIPAQLALATGIGLGGQTLHTEGLVQQLAAAVKRGVESADWSQIGRSITQRIGDETSRQARGHDWSGMARSYLGPIMTGFHVVQEEGARDVAQQIGRMIRAGIERAANISPGDIKNAVKALPGLIVESIMGVIGTALGGAIGLLEGVTGKRFKGSVRSIIASVPGIILGFLGDIYGAAARIADRIVAGIKTAPGKLAGLAGDLGGKIIPALRQAASDAYSWAVHIGERIATGVLDGLKGLPGKIASAVNPFQGGQPRAPGKGFKTGTAVAHKAAGDVINHPMLAVIGEDAPRWPEWVIPSNPQHRGRALGLLSQATSALGLPGFAAGGGPRGGHARPVRKRGGVSLKSVVGAAKSSLSNLAKIQQSVQDAQRTYDQTDRLYGISDEALTVDVPDDPADPTNTGTHAVRNEPGISTHIAELTDLVNRKGGIMKLLRDEQQAIEDAIKAIQKAIDELLAAIADLQEKAKAAGAEARSEHRAAAADSLSVSRKGGLQDQVAAERAKKKPSKSIIARLESQIKDAGRSHDAHETAAKQAETNQGRYQKQAQDDAGRVRDLRGSLLDLGKQKHDLPFDIRDQELDVIQLQADIARTSGTTSTTYTPAASTTSTGAGAAAGGATTITDVISADLLAELQRYREAFSIEAAQLNVLGGMPSFQSGTAYVPNDMVAMLHAGESVRTADQTASDFRNQTSGGPFTIHVTGVAITDQMDAWVEQNGQRLSAQIISDIGRNADTLRRENRLR